MNARIIISVGLLMAGLSIAYAEYDQTLWPTVQFGPDNSDPSWMTTPWTGSSKLYVAIEQKVDRDIARAKSLDDVLKPLDAFGVRSPNDPLAQFAIGYAVDRARYKGYQFLEPMDYNAMIGVRRTDPKNVYEVTRLRFLLDEETCPNCNNVYLFSISQRLLTKHRSDVDVHADMIFALLSNRNGLKQGVECASEWVDKEPRDPTAARILGLAWELTWGNSGEKDIAAVDAAIKNYQEYLALVKSDPNDRHQTRTKYLLQLLQRERAKAFSELHF